MRLTEIYQKLKLHGLAVQLVGAASQELTQVASLEHASAYNVTFLNTPKYAKFLKDTLAGVVILSDTFSQECTVPHIIVKNPYYAYALVAQWLHPIVISVGIDIDASVSSTAKISKSVSIQALAVIRDNVQIGDNSYIGCGAIIEKNAQIGKNCRIGSNVVICHGCVIGNDVTIESGAVIGGDGFGWVKNVEKWHKIPHVGGVVIGDYVSIGNNSCIDRGTIGDTLIADYCIIDNLVHIAHNVELGKATAVAAQSGFAGSTILGANCTVAGQVNFSGHIKITDNSHFYSKAGVTHNIPKPGVYSGFPAIIASNWRKNSVLVRNLDKMAKQVKDLQQQINALTKKID